MTTSAPFLVLCAFVLTACGAVPVHDPHGLIPRADDASYAWSLALETCSETPEGGTRLEGRIATSWDGISTQLLCPSPGCCNDVGWNRYELATETGRTTLRFDESARSHVPEVMMRGGGVKDCEWQMWSDIFEATPVAVVGSFEGEVFRVTEICRGAP